MILLLLLSLARYPHQSVVGTSLFFFLFFFREVKLLVGEVENGEEYHYIGHRGMVTITLQPSVISPCNLFLLLRTIGKTKAAFFPFFSSSFSSSNMSSYPGRLDTNHNTFRVIPEHSILFLSSISILIPQRFVSLSEVGFEV